MVFVYESYGMPMQEIDGIMGFGVIGTNILDLAAAAK